MIFNNSCAAATTPVYSMNIQQPTTEPVEQHSEYGFSILIRQCINIDMSSTKWCLEVFPK